MRPHALAARMAGHRRWVERMRALKAAGVIDRFPGGSPPRGSPRRSSNRIIARAQRVIEEVTMATRETTVPAVPAEAAALPAKPRGAMALPEKLDHASNTSLDRIQRLLDRDVDETDTKTLGMQTTAALTVLGYKIKLDTERMREQWREVDSYADMYAGFQTPGRKSIDEILHEVEDKEGKK
jgi:hypothetical protein